MTIVEVRRDDLAHVRTTSAPSTGSVLLRVEEFALTANTITYARLGYWQVFPAGDPAWGRIPVWGAAQVVTSDHPEVEVGRQLFGFVPMGSHFVLRPSRVGRPGLTDGSPHRAELSAVYNNYQWLEPDEQAGMRAVLLPVFALSFLLDAFVADRFGDVAVVVTSASSKAALGLAHRLATRGLRATGLTSPANATFTRSLDVYREVLTYHDISALPREPTVLLDIAGNGEAVRDHLGDRLVHWARAGLTHGTATEGTWFFVPDEMRRRVRDWGGADYERRFGAALAEFTTWAGGWLKPTRVSGTEAVVAAYQRLLAGDVDPTTALLADLS